MALVSKLGIVHLLELDKVLFDLSYRLLSRVNAMLSGYCITLFDVTVSAQGAGIGRVSYRPVTSHLASSSARSFF